MKKIYALIFGGALLFITPFSMLIWQVLQDLDYTSETLFLEKNGLLYHDHTLKLMIALQDHRRLSLMPPDQIKEEQEQFATVKNSINKQFLEIETLAQDSFIHEQISRHLIHLKEDWQKFNRRLDLLTSQERFVEHSSLLEDVQTFMKLIARSSRLTVDSNFTNKYLIDTITHHVPNILLSFAQVTDQLHLRAQNASTARLHHEKAAYFLNKASNIIEAYEQDDSLHTAYEKEFHNLIEENKNFVASMQRHLIAPVEKFSQQIMRDKTAELTKKNTLFYQSIANEITQNLNANLHDNQKKKYILYVLCFLILTAMVFVFLMLFRLLISKSKIESELLDTQNNLEKQIIQRTRQLESSSKQLIAVLDAVVDGIITMDKKGNIETFNPAAEEIFGYNIDDIFGQNFKTLIAQSQQNSDDEYVNEYLKTHIIKPTEKLRTFFAKRKDGSIFPMEIGISSMNLSKNEKFTAIIRDITERQKDEEKIHQYALSLEWQAQELEMAIEQTDEANKMKSEFLANMSHEIRTPMNGIIGMTELLLETDLNYKQQNYTRTVVNSADALLNIINEILDFSKIESGKMELDPQPFDMMTLLEDTADLLSVKAREKAIEFIIRYAPNTPHHLIGDSGRIRQIINNLAGNAIKFTDKGYVLIDVQEENNINDLAPHKKILKVCITDTGIGIAKEAQEKIFEKFSQADASTTRKFGGTGLGLAISQQLSELMGGDIGVTSEEGKGSTFWFTMVLDEDLSDHQKPHQDTKTLSGLRALIVDDIAINRQLIKEYLYDIGVDSYECADSQEALALLEQAKRDHNPFDIALIDYLMPNMNGEELAKAIRASDIIGDMPLALLTSAGHEGRLHNFFEVGFNAYIDKPIKAQEFKNILTMMWGKHTTDIRHRLITSDSLTAKNAQTTDDRDLQFSRPRILLAEDNRVNQALVVEIMEQAGCRVEVAINGQQVLDKVEKGSFDFIFMDCEMPEMNGFEATSILSEWKSHNKINDIPIAALTANAMKGDKERCFEVGMIDYVTKPLRKDKVLSTIAKWLPEYVIDQDHEALYFDDHHILLVEDNRVNRMLAEEILTEFGLSVTLAEDGAIAVEKIQQDVFDLILMDCQMPNMDGFEATAKIRDFQKNQTDIDIRTPIVALTANAMPGDKEKCLNAGMDDYITKPIKKDVLSEALARWITPNTRNTHSSSGSSYDIDHDILNTYKAVMGSNLHESIRLYLQNIQTLISQFILAYEENRISDVVFIAHTLKANSDAIGMRAFAQAAKLIEDEVRSHMVNDTYSQAVMQMHIQHLQKAYEAIHQYLSKLMREHENDQENNNSNHKEAL